jgi:gas vesicle protein
MGSGSDEVDELRQQIDESRENLGAAVGALAYKADVKQRGKEVIDDKKEAVMEKVDELKSKVPGGGDGEGGGLGEKVDSVKAKLPDADALKAKLPDGVSDAAAKLGDKTPSGDEVKDKAHGLAATAKEHPAAIAGGAAVAGLAAGLAIPETQLERDKLAPAAQDARAEVTQRVHDTVQQVKSGVQDAAGSVADAVKEQGQHHGGKAGELAEKAADKAHDKVGPS